MIQFSSASIGIYSSSSSLLDKPQQPDASVAASALLQEAPCSGTGNARRCRDLPSADVHRPTLLGARRPKSERSPTVL